MDTVQKTLPKQIEIGAFIMTFIGFLGLGYLFAIVSYHKMIYPSVLMGSHFVIASMVIILWTRHLIEAEIADSGDKADKFEIFSASQEALEYHHLTDGGYVYLLQDVQVTGYVKIGMSINPYKRLRDFGVKLPFNTRLIHVIKSKDARRLEQWLHTRYRKQRIRGEWFTLSQDDIDFIQGIPE